MSSRPPAEKDDLCEQTTPNSDNTAQIYDISGPATPNTVNLYRDIFRKNDVTLVSRSPVAV